ncbi:MAG: sensor histidine kinase [Bacteroidia bacterium]|nr:sensor histidine kinase [Bacteroidia bacterium]
MAIKNPTPREIAVFSALAVSLIVLITEIIFWKFGLMTTTWIPILSTFFLSFIATYFIFIFFLEVFIYRKIKLIYKTINRFKDSKEKTLEQLVLKSDIIGNVSREVQEWDKNRSEEIAELKKLEVFRQEFLGNVSHELKTPIFNIQGYIHTLLDGGLDDDSVNIHYLQRAAKSAERLCLIVEDLEEISKLETGELTLDIRTFDLYDLVADVFESQELHARERKITLGFKEKSLRPAFVMADKERIRQVFVNLIVNSIKYGKEGGSTLVGFYDMDQSILTEITDNGIGIDPQHLPRLFERFYRVDKSRSRDQGGTGLGLSIVKHILEAHKQIINVRSSSGIGTTFSFALKKAR